MMPLEMTSSAQQDESAVAAVRRGDAERYRELVERHERRVFAVAWSRLGDAALAEEAAQEAFIRGYRRLWLLGDGAKFAAWITTIARHAAINLGLRHRRELNKRERWALEQPPPPARPPANQPNFARRKRCAKRWPNCPPRTANVWCCFISKAKAARKPPPRWEFRRRRCACDCIAPARRCGSGWRKNSKAR